MTTLAPLDARLAQIVRATSEYVLAFGPDLRLDYLNPAARHLLGLGAQGVDARPWSTWSEEILHRTALGLARREGVWRGELALVRADGAEVPVSVALVEHREGSAGRSTFSALCRDLTTPFARGVELLGERFDALTGLPTRATLMHRLRASLEQRLPDGRPTGVLAIRVDQHQLVLHSLGHESADLLLAAVAERLQEVMRAGDLLGRLDAEGFLAVVEVNEVDEAIRLGERLREALDSPFAIQGRSLAVTASVGVAADTSRPERAEVLVHEADTGRRLARERGGDRVEVFDDRRRAEVAERLEIESGLRLAIPRGELSLFYQPEISLLTGRIAGFEALLRWRHPQRGVVSPMSFIGVAEATGLIVPVGLWALGTACRQARAWNAGLGDREPIFVSVNLSPRQFAEPGFLESVDGVLQVTGVDPGTIVLEVTESVVAESSETVIQTLAELRRLGLRLAIDDFGSGYSSLNYIKRFPADILKIDRAFVAELERDQQDWEIVNAVVSLAHAMDLAVVAEGVETGQQAGALAILEADYAQGYFYAKPAPAEQAAVLLREGGPWSFGE